MTLIQTTALCMQLGLLFFARGWPRLRAYIGMRLVLAVCAWGLGKVPVTKPYVGIDLAVVLLEGLLFVASPVALAWAIKASWRAVGMFAWSAWLFVVLTWPRVSGAPLLTYYLLVQLVCHVYIVASILWRAAGRTEKCPEERALFVLATVGLSGVGIALVWRDDWGVVSVGNMLAYAFVCLLCLRREAK